MNLKFLNTKHNVEVSQENQAILVAKVDNNNKRILLRKIDKNTFSPYHDNLEQHFYAAKDDKHIYVMIDGFQYIFELLPDEAFFMSDSEINDDNHDHIKSPMPGVIVKILVDEGQKVDDGTPIIIIEAMKMETKLYSSINGIVSKVNCKVGEQVDSDIILLEIIKE